MVRPAVYRVVCTPNGYEYIGSALDPGGRWSRHQYDLKRNKHHSAIFQNCWNRYGKEGFVHEIVEWVSDPVDLVSIEQKHLDAAFARGLCMNIERTAGSSLGRKHTPETLAKLRGHPVSAETKERISASHKGKHVSEETKAKIARAMRGRAFSPETRAKLSASASARPPPSEDTKRKISAARKGRKHTKEARERMSKERTGKPHTPSWRENLSKAHRDWTDEQAYELVFVQGLTFVQAGKVLNAWRDTVARAARREKARREGHEPAPQYFGRRPSRV